MTLEEALNESLKLKGGNFITSAFRKWSLDWSKYAVIKLNEKFLDNESILFAIDISMTNKHFDNTSGFFVITNIRVLFYYTDGTIERLDVLPLNAIQTLELGGSDIWSHLHIVEFYEYIRNAKCTCVSDFSNVWKRICYRLLQAFLSVYSKRWLACKIRECLMKYSWETSEYVSSLASWSEKYPILKSNFDKGVSVWFEGKQYNAPMGYDNWLKLIYGNYMQLPPEEKRILGHAVTAFYK